jgi:hypothetical protein
MNRRPLPVLLIACVYIATGAIGFAFYLSAFKMVHPFPYDAVWASLVSLIAVLAGVYMLRGNNWARSLALAWMAFHVVLSIFHSRSELAIHSLLFAALAYLLFRPEATQYFRGARTLPT